MPVNLADLASFRKTLADQAAALTSLADAEIAQSATIYAQLPEAERHILAAQLANALVTSITANSPEPLLGLLRDGTLPADRPIADTQSLFGLIRRSTLNLLRAAIAAQPDAGISFVNYLGDLMSAAREAEVERHFAHTQAELARLQSETQSQLEELKALRSSLEAQVLEQTAELRTFKAIVDEALDAAAITTPAGVLVYANQSFATMSGFGDAVVGSAIPDYHPPEEISRLTQRVLPELLAKGRWQGTMLLQRPDGSRWTGQLSAFVLRDAQGRPEVIAAFYRDVTEERRRAEELSQAVERLEQIFRTSPLATMEADEQGVIRRWNPGAERIFGWTAEEAIGRNAIELLVPNLALEHVSAVVSALLSGQATNSRNVNRTKEGRLITCQWHNAVLRSSDGTVMGWLSQTEDISDQLRAIQQLEESEAYLQAIFRAMNDLVMVLDSEGVYLSVAPTQPELTYNYSTNLLGRRIMDFVPSEEAAVYRALIGEVLANGKPLQHTYSSPGPEGETFYNATVSKLSDNSVLWVARDVTGQLRDEQERMLLQEQVIEAQQAALRELSTPIIPITDGTIAMPLIGSIDSARAQAVIESLLLGVSEMRASTAILDITGVPVVDTQVADALLRAAQAVKLLGARVILTGIRPEVAQTLVGLGLDLSSITTLATLQNGIAAALARR